VNGESSLDYLSAEDLLEISPGVIEGDVVKRDQGLLASASGAACPGPARSAEMPTWGSRIQAAALMHSLPNGAFAV
jgi:hypothetical protein